MNYDIVCQIWYKNTLKKNKCNVISDSEIEEDEVDEEGEGVRNFSRTSVEDDKEKGEAVRNQLGTSIDTSLFARKIFHVYSPKKNDVANRNR